MTNTLRQFNPCYTAVHEAIKRISLIGTSLIIVAFAGGCAVVAQAQTAEEIDGVRLSVYEIDGETKWKFDDRGDSEWKPISHSDVQWSVERFTPKGSYTNNVLSIFGGDLSTYGEGSQGRRQTSGL